MPQKEQENMQPLASAGKRIASQVKVGFEVGPDWLKRQHICSDWLIVWMSLEKDLP